MIVLAVLLLLAVVAVVVFVLMTGVDQTVQLTADWLSLDWRPSALVVFLLGALTLFVAEIALAMLRSGARRSADRRRELKRLRDAERERAAAPVAAVRRDERPANQDAADERAADEPVTDEATATATEPDDDRPHYPDQRIGYDQTGTSTPESGGTWHDDPGGKHTDSTHTARPPDRLTF